MRIRRCGAFAATACTVVLATISLGACGPDAGPSAAGAGTSAAATQAALPQSLQTASAEGAPASSAKVAYSADAAGADADAAPPHAFNAVQSVQASLAADSRQIAPVLSYAPGDADAPADDSRRTPTSSQ